MQNKYITIEINISQINGKQMPEESDILDGIINHLYDHVIGDSAVIDTVLITQIDGIDTHEDL